MRSRLAAVAALVLLIGLAANTLPAHAAKTRCTDPLGCVVVGKDEPLKVATFLATSGDLALLGIDSQHGVEIAADFRGAVLGHPLELVHFDGGCDPAADVTIAAQIVNRKDIVATIGTTCSSGATAVAPLFSDAGMILLSPSNTDPALTDPATHEPFYLRTGENDVFQGSRMADFVADELGLATAATIDDSFGYSVRLRQAFVEAFTAAGGTIVAQEQVENGESDFTNALATVAGANPDFIFFPMFLNHAALVQQARDTTGLEDVGLGTNDVVLHPDFIAQAGTDAEGVYAAGPDFGDITPPFNFPNPDYQDVFLPQYESRFGTPPRPWHAHAFDGMNITLNAIEQVAIQSGKHLLIPRQGLRDALFATASHSGLIGNVTCGANGDCNPNVFIVQQVQNGEFVQVSP